MASLLELARDLPEITLAPGEALCREGEPGGSIWVLVSGSLRIVKGDMHVNTVSQEGAILGEVAVLLGTPASASVVADSPCRLRHAEDGGAFLRSEPAVTSYVAATLAERLQFMTTYLADLKHQYGDVPGIAMVGDVLNRLAARQAPHARPGSARDPDPQY